MKESGESPDNNKLVEIELPENRYVIIPENFTKKIQLDNERNIVLKSNNNIWFFEIWDPKEVKEISEEVKVHVDENWGFKVPLMKRQLIMKPHAQDFIFFEDKYGIGCGNAATYIIWANGKLNKERNKAEGFKTMEKLDKQMRDSFKIMFEIDEKEE
jgi:hypothetical protein